MNNWPHINYMAHPYPIFTLENKEKVVLEQALTSHLSDNSHLISMMVIYLYGGHTILGG